MARFWRCHGQDEPMDYMREKEESGGALLGPGLSNEATRVAGTGMGDT